MHSASLHCFQLCTHLSCHDLLNLRFDGGILQNVCTRPDVCSVTQHATKHRHALLRARPRTYSRRGTIPSGCEVIRPASIVSGRLSVSSCPIPTRHAVHGALVVWCATIELLPMCRTALLKHTRIGQPCMRMCTQHRNLCGMRAAAAVGRQARPRTQSTRGDAHSTRRGHQILAPAHGVIAVVPRAAHTTRRAVQHTGPVTRAAIAEPRKLPVRAQPVTAARRSKRPGLLRPL
jgi:hypothetical protein